MTAVWMARPVEVSVPVMRSRMAPKILMPSPLMTLIVPLTGTRADFFRPSLCSIESPRRLGWQTESFITTHWIGFIFGMDKRM